MTTKTGYEVAVDSTSVAGARRKEREKWHRAATTTVKIRRDQRKNNSKSNARRAVLKTFIAIYEATLNLRYNYEDLDVHWPDVDKTTVKFFQIAKTIVETMDPSVRLRYINPEIPPTNPKNDNPSFDENPT